MTYNTIDYRGVTIQQYDVSGVLIYMCTVNGASAESQDLKSVQTFIDDLLGDE